MNGINYLADTNCFIFLFNAHPLLLPFADSRWSFSFITEMELLSKKGLTKDEDAFIRRTLSSCPRFGHTQAITDLTVSLRRKYSLKLPDAIIAATAQSAEIPLLTADKAFAQIKEIDCVILDLN